MDYTDCSNHLFLLRGLRAGQHTRDILMTLAALPLTWFGRTLPIFVNNDTHPAYRLLNYCTTLWTRHRRRLALPSAFHAAIAYTELAWRGGSLLHAYLPLPTAFFCHLSPAYHHYACGQRSYAAGIYCRRFYTCALPTRRLLLACGGAALPRIRACCAAYTAPHSPHLLLTRHGGQLRVGAPGAAVRAGRFGDIGLLPA